MSMEMTREETIKLLRKFVHQFDGRDVEDAFVEDVLEAAADMLEQDAQGWISVKDRLPTDDATYLACGCDGYLLADYAGDGEWEAFDLTDVTRYVSYWMPLPKEPEEEEK